MCERLSVRVKTNSGIDDIVEYDEASGIIVVKLKAKAQNNRANIALIKFLSTYFRKKIRIVSGKTSRNKVVELY